MFSFVMKGSDFMLSFDEFYDEFTKVPNIVHKKPEVLIFEVPEAHGFTYSISVAQKTKAPRFRVCKIDLREIYDANTALTLFGTKVIVDEKYIKPFNITSSGTTRQDTELYKLTLKEEGWRIS